MKNFLIITILLTVSSIAQAQQNNQTGVKPSPLVKSAATTTSPIQIPEAAQTDIAMAQSSIKMAASQLEAAQLRFENLILRLRLVFKIPDNYEAKVDKDGKVFFEAAANQEVKTPVPVKP